MFFCGFFSSSLCFPQEFPIRSNLDPALYGPPESAITKELLEQELSGMSLEQVLYISAAT